MLGGDGSTGDGCQGSSAAGTRA